MRPLKTDRAKTKEPFMPSRRTEVIVIGGGQAGLAMSYYLTAQGQDHLVLEQRRIAESWRSKRWDSLRLIGPNWTLRLPGYAYSGDDPGSFMGKDDVVGHLMTYAASFGAPVREGVNVTAVERDPTGSGFVVRTEEDTYNADQVVIATGGLQRPFVPELAADLPPAIAQYVPYTYQQPAALPPGAVLIVGSGQSGCQIAEELRRAGRTVYLSVTRSWGMARRYRGRDAAYWARAVGWSQRKVVDLPPGVRAGLPNPQLSGADGGHDLTLYTLAREGVQLLGRIRGFHDGTAFFDDDLPAKLTWGDEQSRRFLRSIDDLVREQGWDAPMEDFPPCLIRPGNLNGAAPDELNLSEAGISAVVWATGYRPDLNWVRLPVLDDEGYAIHRRGVTAMPGCYFLGLDWLYTAHSSQFGGMSDDATYLASVMADQRPKTPAMRTIMSIP
jgi:putative flavoprotein involved in K+ transport